MAPPPIQVFLTTIASQPALRQRQEYILRILQVKKIPFISYDLASDENAKRLWKKKSPADKYQLPGILIGDEFPGTFQDFELAVEQGELDIFLRRNEDYKPFVGDGPILPQQPIGVPGVATPLQMTPERLKKHVLATPAPSPMKGKIIPVNKRESELDMGVELSGYGLQGVKVTKDELNDLLEELEHELKHGLNLKKGETEKGPGTVVQTKDKGKGVQKGDPEMPKVIAADEDDKSKDPNIKEEDKEQKPVEADEPNPFLS